MLENINDLFEKATPLIQQMKEMNAGICKLTPDIGGKKAVMIVIVIGESEVAEITAAIQKCEDGWETSKT